MSNNPMQTLLPFQLSPRCKAKSKRSGVKCKNPAVRGWHVCRMHGARGGAPCGKGNGNYKAGYYTKDAKRDRKDARDAIKAVQLMRKLVARLG